MIKQTIGYGMVKMNKERFWLALREPCGDYNTRLAWHINESRNDGRISDVLGDQIIDIADKFFSKPNFINFQDLEDIKAAAILKVCEYIFKCDNDKPLAWIVTMFNNSVRNYIDNKKRLVL